MSTQSKFATYWLILGIAFLLLSVVLHLSGKESPYATMSIVCVATAALLDRIERLIDFKAHAQIARLVLGQDDAVVVTLPPRIPLSAVEVVTEQCRAAFPGRRCVIVHEGVKIEVLGASE